MLNNNIEEIGNKVMTDARDREQRNGYMGKGKDLELVNKHMGSEECLDIKLAINLIRN